MSAEETERTPEGSGCSEVSCGGVTLALSLVLLAFLLALPFAHYPLMVCWSLTQMLHQAGQFTLSTKLAIIADHSDSQEEL
jgi:hypothetical protein